MPSRPPALRCAIVNRHHCKGKAHHVYIRYLRNGAAAPQAPRLVRDVSAQRRAHARASSRSRRLLRAPGARLHQRHLFGWRIGQQRRHHADLPDDRYGTRYPLGRPPHLHLAQARGPRREDRRDARGGCGKRARAARGCPRRSPDRPGLRRFPLCEGHHPAARRGGAFASARRRIRKATWNATTSRAPCAISSKSRMRERASS